MWQVVNQIIGKLKNKQSIIDHLTIEGVKYYNEIDINNAFGKYLHALVRNCSNQIDKPDKDAMYCLQKIPKIERSLFITLTNKIEIKKWYQPYLTKTVAGIDNISNNLLKNVVKHYWHPSKFCLTDSFLVGVLPKCMKNGWSESTV